MIELTDEIDDTVRDTKSASSLDTATDILDLGVQLCAGLGAFKVTEECFRQSREASHDIATNEILGFLVLTLLRDLDLELAATETEIEDLLDARDLASGEGSVVLGDLIAASDTEIDAAFTDEGWDVGGGEEDERDGQVLDERDVEAGFATELDVTACEEV